MKLSATQAEVLAHIVKFGHGRIKARTADALVARGLAEWKSGPNSRWIEPTEAGRELAR